MGTSRRARGGRRSALSTVALVALLATVAGSIPAVASASSNRPQEYLALGDSLAFGFSPLVDPSNADNFIGYPEIAAQTLKLNLTNSACPGETSSHFISLTGSDNGCGAWRFLLHRPLRADYTTAQLAYADAFLQSHPKTRVVSFDMGANDLFALIGSCGGPTNEGCVLAGLPGMLATFSANLDTIYGHIRNVDGYRHKLVGLTFYARDYRDPISTGVALQVNQVFVQRTLAWGGVVADGFGAFAAASGPYGGDTCAAGLRIVVSTSPLVCDDHPSPKGRDLLAQAVVEALRPD